MGEREHLTISEYERGQKALERSINNGFARMESRFDNLDRVTDSHGERLAVLEAAQKATKREKTKSIALTSGGIATVIVGVFEAIRALLRSAAG